MLISRWRYSPAAPLVATLLFTLLPCSPPATAWPDGRVVDMSYPYNAQTIYWPTEKGFEKSTRAEGMTDKGFYYSAYSVKTPEHGGTHLDAPIHFAEGRQTADQVPLERMMGPAAVVDVSAAALADADYLVSVPDLQGWEKSHGLIPDGAILLLHTGYGRFWPDRKAYMGTDVRGPEAVPLLHFPGLSPEAAQFLVDERGVGAVGIDTPSIDYGQSSEFMTHRILLGENIPVFENVANLEQLPATGSIVVALPMKIEGGSGAPLRMVGIINGP